MLDGILGVIDAYNKEVRANHPNLYEYERGQYIHVHISQHPPKAPASSLAEQLKRRNNK